MEHYSMVEPLPEIERPLRHEMLKRVVPVWYANYIEEMSMEVVFELI